MKNLTKLQNALAALEQHHADVAGLTALDAEKATRELVLLETVNLHDSKSLSEISELRLVRELIPRKLTAMEASFVTLTAALKAEVVAAFPLYNGQHGAKCEALRARLRKYLEPIVANPALLDRRVAEAWQGHALAVQLVGLSLSTEFSTNAAESNPEGVARKLLEAAAALEAITIPDKL